MNVSTFEAAIIHRRALHNDWKYSYSTDTWPFPVFMWINWKFSSHVIHCSISSFSTPSCLALYDSVQLLTGQKNFFPLMYCLYITKCQSCRNVKDCRATWERLRVGKKYQLMSPGLPLTELQPLWAACGWRPERGQRKYWPLGGWQ